MQFKMELDANLNKGTDGVKMLRREGCVWRVWRECVKKVCVKRGERETEKILHDRDRPSQDSFEGRSSKQWLGLLWSFPRRRHGDFKQSAEASPLESWLLKVRKLESLTSTKDQTFHYTSL